MNLKKPFNYYMGLPLLMPLFKSKVLKSKEDYDHMQSQIDQIDHSEGNELSELLMNPNFEGDPEQLMEESMFNSVNPPQFSYLHSQLKNSLDHESWKGAKFLFSWHPTMSLNTEFQLNVDKPRGFPRNYSFTTTSIIPSNL